MYLTSTPLKALGLFLWALALSQGVLASPLVRRDDALAPRWNDTNVRLNINTTSLPPPFTTFPPFTTLSAFPTRTSSTSLPPFTTVAPFAAPPPVTSLSSTTTLPTLSLPPPFTTRPPFTSLPPVTTSAPFTNLTIPRLAARTIPYNSTTIS
ncbi:hypothetical protein GE09DRAFT_1056561 [Coniochaeta sp. 2T2.1]|nr:hypothetical protein GE09DRAFT_1056561 [Coniochaeta sp. 2T2.1]